MDDVKKKLLALHQEIHWLQVMQEDGKITPLILQKMCVVEMFKEFLTRKLAAMCTFMDSFFAFEIVQDGCVMTVKEEEAVQYDSPVEGRGVWEWIMVEIEDWGVFVLR